MSRSGRRRSRPRRRHSAAPLLAHPFARPTTDAPDEIRHAAGAATASTSDECVDDRPVFSEQDTARLTQSSSSTVDDDDVDGSRASTELELPGAMLRERREERGMTLDQVARTTKISKNVLRALEASDVQHLPADIYTRGFVKAYAQEVGLDPETTAAEYLRKVEPLRSRHLPVEQPVPTASSHGTQSAHGAGDAPMLLITDRLHRFGRPALAAAATGLILYFAAIRQGEDARPVRPGDTADYGDVARAGGLLRATTDVGTHTPAALSDQPLRVEFVPRGPCWLSIDVDGVTVFAKLLQAGDHETIDVSDEAVVRVGEPGALSYSINGQSGRRLGPAGVPITVRISKDNFHEFLSS